MKRPSDTPQQLEIPIFFLDRNLGREILPALLRNAGFVIQVHDEHFPPSEEDEVWLEKCGKRKWIAITPDTHILKDPIKMRVIGINKGRVFFLSSNNSRSEIWAEAIIHSWKEITSALNKHQAPFVARIYPVGGVWQIQELTKAGRIKKRPAKRGKHE